MWDDCRGAMDFEEDEWVRDEFTLSFLDWRKIFDLSQVTLDKMKFHV